MEVDCDAVALIELLRRDLAAGVEPSACERAGVLEGGAMAAAATLLGVSSGGASARDPLTASWSFDCAAPVPLVSGRGGCAVALVCDTTESFESAVEAT